jgi:hypothetical protein
MAVACVILAAGLAPAASVLSPSEAGEHVGEAVVVEGHLDTVVCSPQACLLSFEPGFSGLVAAIPGDAVARFRDPEALEARRVRVSGVVADRGGRPRIELREPSALEVVDGSAAATVLGARSTTAGGNAEGSRPPSAAGAGAAGSTPERRVEVHVDGVAGAASLTPDEAGRRLGLAAPASAGEAAVGADAEIRLLRQDLAAMSARLAGLETALAQLDGRLADVEQIADQATIAEEGAGSAPSGGLPSYVVPGSTAPSLHRIGRGWTIQRVIRVLGEPMQVAGHPPGPYTWYYDGGRALTVNEYGRVVSAVGF